MHLVAGATAVQTLHAASAKLGPPTDLGFPSMSKAFWFEPKFHPNLMAEHFYRRILIAAGYIEARKQVCRGNLPRARKGGGGGSGSEFWLSVYIHWCRTTLLLSSCFWARK